jgi:hypothetical protein
MFMSCRNIAKLNKMNKCKINQIHSFTKYYFSLWKGPLESWHDINIEASLQLAQVHTWSSGPLFTERPQKY